MKINGPIEILYAVTVIFAVMSIVLFLGKGSWLIAGYNTASKEEKEKYDERKLGKIVSGCTGFIAIILFITCFIWDRVPEYFVHILTGLIVLDVIITMVLANTLCKKK